MIAFLRILPARVWIGLGVVLVVLLAFAAYKYQQNRADRAEAALAPAKATVEALDKVNTETVAIQADTTEKQRDVQNIEGANDRLPDGFADSLQRLRDRKSD